MIKVIVNGAKGKMGKAAVQAIVMTLIWNVLLNVMLIQT